MVAEIIARMAQLVTLDRGLYDQHSMTTSDYYRVK